MSEPSSSEQVELAPSEAEPQTADPKSGPIDHEHEEVKSLLGPDVRTPVGIPRKYRPVEVSTHALFKVELGAFAGPLDLLLFLIRQHDIDIFDIPISFITERYLEMLDAMTELSIDVAGEFLVMAAELTHIKSKMLLPPKEGIAVDDEDEDEGDPRAELVRRLLEYQKYRDVANELGDFDQLGRDVFPRIPPPGGAPDDFDPGLRDTSIFRLVEAMADVLSRLEPKPQHEVTTDWVNITDQIDYIYDYAAEHGTRFSFRSLFRGFTHRRMVLITFLAILELARLKALRIDQTPEVYEEALPPLSPEPLPDAEPLALGPEPRAAAPIEAPIEPASEVDVDAETLETLDEPEVSLDSDEPDEAPPPARVRLAFELPPLEAPAPSEIILELVGPKPSEASGFDEPPPESAFEDEDALDADPEDSSGDADPDLT